MKETYLTFLSNLKHAVRNNETVYIGGGEFSADELKDVVIMMATLYRIVYEQEIK